jgi:hypothetical protein
LRGQWLPAAKLEAALDQLAKDRAWPPASATGGGADWFHDAPPLALTGGQVAWRATFDESFAGTPAGATRLAVEIHKDGRRTIVAQSAARPPRPKLSTLRLEIDPSGHASAFTLDEDGKRHGTATASGGKAHFTGDLGGKPVTDEIPMGPDDVFDATLVPVAERAFQLAPGATVVVRGVRVLLKPVASSGPGVAPEIYEITRKADGAHGEHTYDFMAQTPFGKMSGAMIVDADGHMVSVVFHASFGEIKIERSSAPL